MKIIAIALMLFSMAFAKESIQKHGFLTQTHPEVILETNDKIYYLKKSFLLTNRDRIAKGKKNLASYLKNSRNKRKSIISDIQVQYSLKKSDILKVKKVPQKNQRKTR